MKLNLILIPVNSPEKGADDLRAKLSGKFRTFFDDLTVSSYAVDGKEDSRSLSLGLLRRQLPGLRNLQGDCKAKAEKNLITMAAWLDGEPLRQEEVNKIIAGELGHESRAVHKAVRAVQKTMRVERRNKEAQQAEAKCRSSRGGRGEYLVLPSEERTSFTETAEALFPLLLKKGDYFRQDRCVCTLHQVRDNYVLNEVTPDELRSRSEKLGVTLMRYAIVNFEKKLVQSNMKHDEAKVLLKTDEAKLLHNVRGLVSYPVLTVKNGKPKIHLDGYDQSSEILVKPKQEMPAMPSVADAVNTLNELFKDYIFLAPSDKSRAMAMFLTTALTTGRVLQEEVPMFFIEADKSATGKGLLVDLMAAIFNLEISYVPKHEGRGAGGQDESFYAALDRGNPVVLFDNWRGKLSSEALEMFMTCRSGMFPIRLPYKEYRGVDPRYYTLAMTSNGCELTNDQANRTVFIRLRKQPEGYHFTDYPEGGLLEHVRANWKKYLAAVYAIGAEWINQGCKRTNVSYNGFTGWARSMDWIVQEIFKLPPLLENMEEEKRRVTSPDMTFLRQLAIAVASRKKLGAVFKAGELSDLAFEAGIVIPGLRKTGDDDAAKKAVGMMMTRAFGENDVITTDAYKVSRFVKQVERKDGKGGSYPSKMYVFEMNSPVGTTPSATIPPASPADSGSSPSV
ncbi:MAG: hypothetical protein WCH99_19925 [Verrucomicrobiota bacterium]